MRITLANIVVVEMYVFFSSFFTVFNFILSFFLFLTARWNDDIIQWLSCLVHEENVVLFLRSILFSLRRLLWHPVWKSWRSAALPYGTYDPLHVESTQS